MERLKTLSIAMPLFDELFDALPQEWHDDQVRMRLMNAYRMELQSLISSALQPDCLEPEVVMRPWRQAGSQWICEFWTSDRAKPRTAAMNFHGLSTSQWRYGGAIVICDGEVSTHH